MRGVFFIFLTLFILGSGWELNTYIEHIRKDLQIKINNHEKRIESLEQIINETANITVKATAYNAVPGQTDSDPDITACMSTPNIGSIAVSQDLYFKGWTCGKRIHIEDLGIFTIKDVMHKRKTNQVDIVKATLKEALEFGIKKNLNAVLLSNYDKM